MWLSQYMSSFKSQNSQTESILHRDTGQRRWLIPGDMLLPVILFRLSTGKYHGSKVCFWFANFTFSNLMVGVSLSWCWKMEIFVFLFCKFALQISVGISYNYILFCVVIDSNTCLFQWLHNWPGFSRMWMCTWPFVMTVVLIVLPIFLHRLQKRTNKTIFLLHLHKIMLYLLKQCISWVVSKFVSSRHLENYFCKYCNVTKTQGTIICLGTHVTSDLAKINKEINWELLTCICTDHSIKIVEFGKPYGEPCNTTASLDFREKIIVFILTGICKVTNSS